MTKRLQSIINITIILFIFITLSGCASHYIDATNYDPYGFFSGILHGFIFPFALIANILSWALSLLNIHILIDTQMIGRPNTGFLFYYIGYFLGLSVWFSK